MRLALAYLATSVVFLGLDALWLSRIALGLYRAELGALLLEQPNLVVAGLFYLLFGFGIVVLAVLPALEAQSWSRRCCMARCSGSSPTAPTTSPICRR